MRGLASLSFAKLSLALIALTLAACGWQLRGYETFKQQGDLRAGSVALEFHASQRLFQATLERQLKDLSIGIDQSATKRLVIHEERSEKRPLSFSATGIPIQYQITMTARFSLLEQGKIEIDRRRYVARRQFDFDIELSAAKKEEEQQLLQEMREELASRIIASLADTRSESAEE